VKAYSTEYPSQTVQKRQNGYAILFDIAECDGGYQYNEVLSPSIDVTPITSAIVRHYYTQDDEFQIINNYLVSGASDEWTAYQGIRNMAKGVATEVVGG